MADIKIRKPRREMRHRRVRRKVHGTSERPRLVIFKSHKHMYCQLVDDENMVTVTGASTLSPELKPALEGKSRVDVATELGKFICKKMGEKEIKQVVFDRNGYKYHGLVKTFAEAVREQKFLA
jgi:large subunit ribosomal protein L18